MSRTYSLLLAGLVACGAPEPAPDGPGEVPPPFDSGYEDNFVRLQRLETSTFIEILEVRAIDDRVFMCTAVQGLIMIDPSDPSDMRRVGEAASSLGSGQYPRCQHLAVLGDAVYISNRGDEIQPQPFITAFDMDGVEGASYVEAGIAFEGMTAADGKLYSAVHAGGVRILDPDLNLLGSVDGLTNAWSVAVDGDALYVADGSAGLAIADVSDPAQATIVGRLPIAGPAQYVEIDRERDIAYVAAGALGVVVVDVSDPAAPVELAVADTPGSALGVALAGGHAFVADWNDARVYDMSDPASPALVATEHINVGGSFPRVLAVGARDDVAFLGEWTGLYSYRLLPDRPAADIRAHDSRFDAGVLTPNDAYGAGLLVSNDGARTLNIHHVELTGPELFPISEAPISIAPGETRSIEVGMVAAGTSVVSGTVTLHSDDPDEPSVNIEMRANTPGIGVGAPAPDVVLDLVEGGSWDLRDHQGEVVVLAYFATF